MAFEYTLDISRWEKSFKGSSAEKIAKADTVLQKVAKEVFDKIVGYTPVGNPSLWHPPYWPKGYTPGTLKASWIMDSKPAIVTISNPQPYAYRVEYGWSSQAPEGMVRRALVEFPILMKKNYESKI